MVGIFDPLYQTRFIKVFVYAQDILMHPVTIRSISNVFFPRVQVVASLEPIQLGPETSAGSGVRHVTMSISSEATHLPNVCAVHRRDSRNIRDTTPKISLTLPSRLALFQTCLAWRSCASKDKQASGDEPGVIPPLKGWVRSSRSVLKHSL